MDKFQVFDPKFNDDELEEEFHNFFYKYNLSPLFTNEHRAPAISVAWIDARSVISPTGSYHNQLKEFSDFLQMSTDNKSYEEVLFKILHSARTFQKMMQNIRKIMDEVKSMPENFTFNMWNVVWYKKVLA